MPAFPLQNGAYTSRSVIANAQRRINYYPELNAKDSPTAITHYQRPGLTRRAAPPAPAIGRGIWQASNGLGFAGIGDTIYEVLPNWNLVPLGDLIPGRTNPISMVDNGIDLVIVDNSANGWTVNLTSRAFAQIVDGTGTFQGATRVDYMDTFVLFNIPNTNQIISSLSNSIAFNPAFIAAKTDWPDTLMTHIVNRHEWMLLGRQKTEHWYDAGGTSFPFAELPGAYTEHGIAAPYSVAANDISVYWLVSDLNGTGWVARQRGYDCQRVSNHGVEVAIRRMRQRGTISDAIGYCYQIDGHSFYVLTFPHGDETWVFDDAMQNPEVAWHQEAWTDSNGVLHRHRVMSHAVLNGVNCGLDWENGNLYELDLDAYSDSGDPVTYVAGFPHMSSLPDIRGQLVPLAGRRVKHNRFIADIEVGEVPLDVLGAPAQISVRWSDDRGKSFGNPVLLSNGQPGEFLTTPSIMGPLGIARDRVYEIFHSVNGPAALNGAWIEGEILDS